MFPILLILIFSLNSFCNANRVENNSDANDVSISYTLWIGSDIDTQHHIQLKVPGGINFYEAMETAASLNPTFKFKSKLFDIGHFITEIAGTANDVANNTFWMIYILPNQPNVDSPPGDKYLSPKGVDLIIVEDGMYYLFWYKEVIYQHQ